MTETCNLCPWHSNDHVHRVVLSAKHFKIFFPAVPMVYREDGGHLIMLPNRHVVDVSDFTKEESLEYMHLMKITSKTMYTLLPKFGIPIGRINYHDNGNLEADKKIGAHQHLHFYGRSRSAVHQKWKSNSFFPDCDPHLDYYKKATHFKDEEKSEIIKSLKELFIQ